MIRLCCFLSAFVLIACTGHLSDEQRKRMKEGMKSQEIKMVTRGRLLEYALELGKADSRLLNTDSNADSIALAQGAKIEFITQETAKAELQRTLFEAYLEGMKNGKATDNIQEIGQDSVLYSSPVIEKNENTEELRGMWNITFSTKRLVLGIE